MSFPEILLLIAASLLPIGAYLFLRRMRTMQQQKIEERRDSLYQDALNLERLSKVVAKRASDAPRL